MLFASVFHNQHLLKYRKPSFSGIFLFTYLNILYFDCFLASTYNVMLSLLTLLLMTVDTAAAISEDLFHPQKYSCFSCASFVYLPLWNQLMHHYFPPKNFTDRCWQPDGGIGSVACTSACFTLVERIDQQDFFNGQRGVLRGCVDRLLLFGLDDDVRNVLTSYNHQKICRETDRKILRLYPLSTESDIVTLCSCSGDHCNDQDMLIASNSSLHTYLYFYVLSLFILVSFLG